MIWCGAYTLVNNKFLPLDLIQFEMLKKGFIAVNAGYDSSLVEYASSPGEYSNSIYIVLYIRRML